jgi:hypothetical protein
MRLLCGSQVMLKGLYRLAFEEAVSGLIKAKPADISEKAARKVGARPKKAKNGSRRKG